MSGKLIVIEGLDGSGKATQTALLCSYIEKKGISYKKLSFPDYDSPASSAVKMYLNGEFSSAPNGVNAYAASSFYAVDRCVSFLKKWQKEYNSGELLIADRYAESNIVYQSGKLPVEERDAFIEWAEDFEYVKLGIPKPDLVIYLDMSVDVSQKLLSERYGGDESKKDIHESSVAFLKQCRNVALYAAQKLDWKIVKCDDGKNPRSIDDIAADIINIADKIL